MKEGPNQGRNFWVRPFKMNYSLATNAKHLPRLINFTNKSVSNIFFSDTYHLFVIIRYAHSLVTRSASFSNGKTLNPKHRYPLLVIEVMMHIVTGIMITAQVTAVAVVPVKVHVINAVKKVTGAQHALTHKGKEVEVKAITRPGPAVMGPILPKVAEGLMGKNLDRVINAGKQVTGVLIVPTLLVATKETRRLFVLLFQYSGACNLRVPCFNYFVSDMP
jgi:hypothetical protein